MAELDLLSFYIDGQRWREGQFPFRALWALRHLAQAVEHEARAVYLFQADRSRAPGALTGGVEVWVQTVPGSSGVQLRGRVSQAGREVAAGEIWAEASSRVSSFMAGERAGISRQAAQQIGLLESGLRADLQQGDRLLVGRREVHADYARRARAIVEAGYPMAPEPIARVIRPSKFDLDAGWVSGPAREGRSTRRFYVDKEGMDFALSAAEGGDDRLLRLRGQATYSEAGGHRADANEVSMVGGPELKARLHELQGVLDGWWGDGSRAPAKSLLRKAEPFLWSLVENGNVDRPYVYPTEEGFLNAEWDMVDGSIGMYLRLEGGEISAEGAAVWPDGDASFEGWADTAAIADWLRAVQDVARRPGVADNE